MYENRDDYGPEVTNMAVHIYEVINAFASSYDFTPSNRPTTVVSATFDVPYNENGGQTLLILLGTNVSLAADTSYMILFDASGTGPQISFEWVRSGSGGGNFYAGGASIKNTGVPDVERDQLVALGATPPPTANDDLCILPGMTTSATDDAPGVLVNDVNYDSAVLVDGISAGTLNFNADGSFSCSGLVNGSNTFTYAVVKGAETSTPATVTLVTTLSEDPPTVVDDTYSVDLGWELSKVVGNVLDNDTNNSILYEMTAAVVTNVTAGTLVLQPTGDFSYTPPLGFTGEVTFTYTASTPLETSVQATVTMTISDVGPLGSSLNPGIAMTIASSQTCGIMMLRPTGTPTVVARRIFSTVMLTPTTSFCMLTTTKAGVDASAQQTLRSAVFRTARLNTGSIGK